MKKIAVITGASSGMGKRFAETVDRYGTFDEVWVIARQAIPGCVANSPLYTPEEGAALAAARLLEKEA